MAARIRTGDMVQVLTGKNKGVRGLVRKIDARNQRVVVERVNMVKKHQKPTAQQRQGGIIEMEKSIALSNVAFVHAGEPTRIGFRIVDGKKVRWSRKHDEEIDG
jgi:large subunit ribosomal protein L24